MEQLKKTWCKVKLYVITSLISFAFFGAGYTARHIVMAEEIIAQNKEKIIDNKDQIIKLDTKIDSTEPAKIAERVKTLQENQKRLEVKIDHHASIQRETNKRILQRQDKMLDYLFEIKKNGK